MASFYLDSCNPAALEGKWWTDLHRLRRSAGLSAGRTHSLAQSEEEADFVLLTDGRTLGQSDLRDYVQSKGFAKPVFVYSVQDHVIPFFPGVYANVESRWYQPAHQRAGFYARVASHEWIQPTPVTDALPYLYSFCGSFDTHPIRGRLQALSSPHGLVRDTSREAPRFSGQSLETYDKWQEQYALTLRQCAFVLCPRGRAPSSHRIFEAMKAGRAPVIVSDQWVEPAGPDWNAFSIRIKEAEIHKLPQILEARQPQAAAMGRRARSEWEAWFSSEILFQTVANSCVLIAEQGSGARLGPVSTFLHAMRPFYFRHYVLSSLRHSMLGARAS